MQPDPLVPPVQLERLGQPEQRVQLEPRDRLGRLGQPDPQDLLVRQVQLEQPDPLGLPGRRVPPVQRVPREPPVLQHFLA